MKLSHYLMFYNNAIYSAYTHEMKFNDDVVTIDKFVLSDSHKLFEICFNNVETVKYDFDISCLENLQTLYFGKIKQIYGTNFHIDGCHQLKEIKIDGTIGVFSSSVMIDELSEIEELDLSKIIVRKASRVKISNLEKVKTIKLGQVLCDNLILNNLPSLKTIIFGETYVKNFYVDENLLRKKIMYGGKIKIEVSFCKYDFKNFNSDKIIEGPFEL